MIEEECLVKGTPAMLAPIVDGYFLRRWERGEGAPRCEIVRERDDTLGLLVRLQDSQRGFVDHGTPGTGAAWLTAQEEPGGLTRLALRCDPADWEAFGLRAWYELRGELARRGLLADDPAVISDAPGKPGPVPLGLDYKLRAWNGWLRVKGRQSQRSYCEQLDPPIAPRTLRNWRDELKREGRIS